MTWLHILQVTLPGFALGAVVMALASRRVPADVARGRWLKLLVFGLIVHVVLGAAVLGQFAVVTVVLLVVAVGSIELTNAWHRMSPPRPRRIQALYPLVAIVCVWVGLTLERERFAALYVMTAAFDGFSQVVGQWLGRTRLAPEVSPAKTVEGLLGGLCAAVVVAVLTRGLLRLELATAALLGVATGLAGLVGDLSASWVKRRARLKDFAAWLPGQGGMLDRFDSLLGSLVFVGVPMVLAGSIA